MVKQYFVSFELKQDTNKSNINRIGEWNNSNIPKSSFFVNKKNLYAPSY